MPKPIRFLLLVLVSCWGSNGSLHAQTPALADTSLVQCVVKSAKASYRYREPMIFDVQLINRSSQPVMLVDGTLNSEVWSYFAELRIEAYSLGKRRSGEKLILNENPGCIRFGARRQNFVLIQPNQAHRLAYTQELGGLLLSTSARPYETLKPGSYEVRFVYLTATRERLTDQNIYYLGSYSRKEQDVLRPLIEQVPVIRAVSAPLFLTITR